MKVTSYPIKLEKDVLLLPPGSKIISIKENQNRFFVLVLEEKSELGLTKPVSIYSFNNDQDIVDKEDPESVLEYITTINYRPLLDLHFFYSS